MRITIEIEDDAEITKVEKLIRSLKPSSLQARRAGKAAKMKKFLGYIHTHPIPVNRIIIPDRQERNAR